MPGRPNTGSNPERAKVLSDMRETASHTWIRPELRALTPYAVAAADGMVKLDAMENPYPWPQDLQAALQERLAAVAINRYPDPAGTALKERLRAAMGIADAQALLLGNGSDELIQMLAMAVTQPGRVVMAPEPSFVMYRLIADFVGLGYQGVPLLTDFQLDVDSMLGFIEAEQPALLFLAYPNNPTGNAWYREDIECLLEACNGLVVVDEAYAPFAADSFVGDLGRFDNLLVLRTVSKMGLAGLRLGYLVGPPAIIDELNKLRLPYNINSLTQAAAELALDNKPLFDAQAAAIRQERERLWQALQTLPGITPFPSQANFILFRTPAGTGRQVFAGLREAGILIKDLSGQAGPLADCLRVTVGTPAENSQFLEALQTVLAAGPSSDSGLAGFSAAKAHP